MAIINGTTDHDTLTGTVDGDTITGMGGNDVIEGGEGADTAVYSGSVRDYIFGLDASGNLTVTGAGAAIANGSDTLVGVETLQFSDMTMTRAVRGPYDYSTPSNWMIANASNDWLSRFGEPGPFIFDGGAGNDRLYGTWFDGRDLLIGGTGNDTLIGNGGDDVMFGGDGDDWFELQLSNSAVTMTGGAGVDTYYINNWQIQPGQGATVGAEKLITDFAPGNGGDIVNMQFLLGTVLGYTGEGFGSSALRLIQDGADVMLRVDIDGDLGPRTLETVFRLKDVNLGDLTAYNFGGYDPAGTPVTPLNLSVPNGDGNGGNDTLTGDANGNGFFGRDGRDSLSGLGGNDYLSGDFGFDSMYGGAGDDELYDSYGANLFDGGDGADIITAHGGAATIIGGSGGDTINAYARLGNLVDAGGGDDVVFLERGLVTLGVGRDILGMTSLPTGPVVVTDFQAGAGGDMLNLTALAQLAGYTGSDPLADGYLGWTQEGGDAVLHVDTDGAGGEAAQVLLTLENVDAAAVVRDNFVQLEATFDDDTLGGIYSGVPLDGGWGDDLLFGTHDMDVLSGDDGNDTLKGGGDSDALDGGHGADHMWGGAGRDTYTVDNAGDVIHENIDEYGYDTVNAWVSYTLGDNVETLNLQAYGLTGQGNGLGNTMFSVFSGRLLGGDGNDTLSGYYGNDTLEGEAGRDWLTGGGGNDLIIGDLADNLDGGDGDDTLQVKTTGIDWSVDVTIRGGAGLDVAIIDASLTPERTFVDGVSQGGFLQDASGRRIVLEGIEVLNFTGNATANTLWGSIYNDTLTGLAKNDKFDGHSGDDLLSGNDGADYLNGNFGDDTLNGGNGADSIFGGEDDDLLLGGERWDLLGGDIGDDTLDGGLDNDQMYGGTGNDLYHVDNVGDRTYENLNEGNDTVISSISWALSADVDNLVLTGTAALTGTGNGLANRIEGNDGANTLSGGASADTIDGGLGADAIDGGIGNDSLVGGGRWDTLTGGDGNDTLDGGFDNDVMYGGLGDDVYYVDNAGDRVNENTGANEGIDRVYASVTWNMSANVETVEFTGTADASSTGNSLHNTMTGNSGNNTLSGGAGHDTINGGDGNDSIDGGTESDVLDGGAGNDTVLGGQRWDTLTGGAGDDVLDGGSENDRMTGNAGNDTYYVDHAGDRVFEVAGEGSDTVYASIDWAMSPEVENLFLTGAAVSGTGNGLNNRITGTSGVNVLNGGNGNDTLAGGTGADTLTGGTGRDDFVFGAAAINGVDQVTDFAHGIDRLVFKGSDYGFAAGHVLTAAQFTLGASAAGTGAQFGWDAATGHLWWDADGTGAGEQVDLGGFGGAPGVTRDDLYFTG